MESQNCWEFWECQKDIKDLCPGYAIDSGKKCFSVAAEYCLRVKKEFNECWDCPFFKNLLGGEGIDKLPS
jgi:hypothetical protein